MSNFDEELRADDRQRGIERPTGPYDSRRWPNYMREWLQRRQRQKEERKRDEQMQKDGTWWPKRKMEGKPE